MYVVIENLRTFFNNRPPLVVFMICLSSFAIALITFAYIVKTKDIPDPDVTEDWNTFLEKFSKIDLCFPVNGSENTFLNLTSGKQATGDMSPSDIYQTLHDKFKQTDFYEAIHLHGLVSRAAESSSKHVTASLQTSPASQHAVGDSNAATVKPSAVSDSKSLHFRNISFTLHMEVVLPQKMASQVSWTNTQFVTFIQGHQLKIKGHLAESELVARFSFLKNASAAMCQARDGKRCQRYLLPACIHLSGPAAMLPNTPLPEECQRPYSGQGEELWSLKFMVPSVPGPRHRADTCHHGSSHMFTRYSFDESLTLFLSQHDRYVVNLRLMRTSYLLFVMVVMFFCYAMIRGRKSKSKNVHGPHSEKVPA